MTKSPNIDEAPIGQILNGRYRIKAALDRGGMGQVFTAWDETLKRAVVVKIPHRDMLRDPRQRERFLAEVRDLAAHQHPSILSIENFGEHGGLPFAVLQYLGGGNLAQAIGADRNRQSLDQIRDWLVPIAEALDFVHSKSCLHRDVKPANIIFDDNRHAFLADFGISTALDNFDSDGPTLEPREQLTIQGGFVGSPAYAPPEAIDRNFTPQYDQYSLATVVYVALTGELPFDGKTPTALLLAKTRDAPTPLEDRTLKSRISGKARDALMRALSVDPGDRFESCAAFADALLAHSGSDRTPRWPGLRVGVLLAVPILVGGYWLWDQSAVTLPRTGTEITNETGGSGGAPLSATEVKTGAPAPPEVQLGSTAEQQQAAVALCIEHGGSCAIDEFADETVRIHLGRAIEIDIHEVTNQAFAAWISGDRIETQAERRGRSRDGPLFVSGLSWREPVRDRVARDHPDDPAVHVSFDEASDFCASKGQRLPTHNEWEFSARGLDQRVFPWGDVWEDGRVRVADGTVGLEPVQSYPAGNTPEGYSDLAGSVWEWTTDESDAKRIIKGGSWEIDQPAELRAGLIGLVPLDDTSSDIGFRCVRDVN